MTDLDLSAEDLRRLLRAATDAVEPRPDAWERLRPRLAAAGTDGADTEGVDVAAAHLAGAPGDVDRAHDGAVVIELDPEARRPGRRRRLPRLAAAVAAALLAGLGLAVPRLAGDDLADGGEVPWFVLGDDTDRYRVLAASTAGAEEQRGSTLLLTDDSGARGYVVRTTVVDPGDGPPPVEATVSATPATTAPVGWSAFGPDGADPQTVTVNGYEAQLAGGDAGSSDALIWSQEGTEVVVWAFGPTTDADELIAVGRGVTVDDDGVPTASFVPAGLRQTVAGENRDVTPRTRYSVDYGAEDLDAPYDDNVSITVSTGGEADLVSPLYGGVTGLTFRTVEVRGRTARLGRSDDPDLPSALLVWREPGDVTVMLGTLGLSDDELLRLAEGLRTVDEAAWRDANRAFLAGDAPGAGLPAVLAEGRTDDRAWRVLDSGTAGGMLCLTLSVADTTETGGCAEGREPLRRVAEAPTSDEWWVLYAVDADVATVTVEQDDGTEVVRAETVVAGAAGRVAVVRLDADKATALVAVARAADGSERSRTAAVGAAPESVASPVIADMAALATAPVVVSGELEGRAWSARARAVGLVRYRDDGTPEAVPGSSLCATVDFAARRDTGLVCEGDGSPLDGTLGVGIADQPRRFVILLLASGTEAPTARLADGTTATFTTAEIPGADGRRVAVLPVARTAAVVSVDAGVGERPVDVPGDPDRPVTFG